ncbi:MAG TPA: glycosyltransferase family 4 protein [Hyphomicrobium sp.]|nr:glycosyltransferase family 4 protein [Hyphomicrobium sp.]
MGRIVFINRYFYPDHSATSQMLSDIAFGLQGTGRSVSIITSRQRYDSPLDNLPPRETIEGVDVHRIWTSRFGRQNLAGRAVDYVTFYLSCALALIGHVRRGDVIVAKTDPPMLSLLAAPIAFFKRAQLVNWMQDVFPEVAEALGMGRSAPARGLLSLLRRLRNRSLKAADANVVLGERMKERLAANGIAAWSIRVIPNFADGSLVTPVARETNPLRTAWGLQDAFVVAYSGNLGRAHEYTTLIDAISRLENGVDHVPGPESSKPSVRPRVAWLFIGGGALHEAFKAQIAKRGLRSVRFEPYQPREKLAQSLSAGDLHLVSLRPDLEGLIVPSKFYGIAAAGRPAIFIGHPDGEIARLLAQHDCGLTVGEGDADALARQVLALANDQERGEVMGRNARTAFDAHWNRQIVLQRWQALLEELQR